MRENEKVIKHSQRDLERERNELDRQEKKLVIGIVFVKVGWFFYLYETLS